MSCRALDRVYDAAYLESEEGIELAHPLGVTLGQVVVDSDNMHAASLKSVEVGRQRRHESLTFTCLHLGDTSLMQDHSSDELHSEVLHAKAPPRALAAYRESLRKDVVESLSLSEPVPEFLSLSSQLVIGQSLHRLVVRLDDVDSLFYLFYFLCIKISEDLFNQTHLILLPFSVLVCGSRCVNGADQRESRVNLVSCTAGVLRSGRMFETESRYPVRRRKLPALANVGGCNDRFASFEMSIYIDTASSIHFLPAYPPL